MSYGKVLLPAQVATEKKEDGHSQYEETGAAPGMYGSGTQYNDDNSAQAEEEAAYARGQCPETASILQAGKSSPMGSSSSLKVEADLYCAKAGPVARRGWQRSGQSETDEVGFDAVYGATSRKNTKQINQNRRAVFPP